MSGSNTLLATTLCRVCLHDMLSTADIHRWLDGSEFMGERLVVQFARGGNRPRDGHFDQPRMAPRPRRTVHRMTITGLPFETSWQVSARQFGGQRTQVDVSGLRRWL